MWKAATRHRCPSRRRRRIALLIDTGNTGAAAARDAGRIMDAIKDAGLQHIDHLITTHWHGDHFGGLGRSSLRRFRFANLSITVPTLSRAKAADTFLQTTYPQLVRQGETYSREGGRQDTHGGRRYTGRHLRRDRPSRRRCPARARRIPTAARSSRGTITPRILSRWGFISCSDDSARFIWEI